MLDATELARHLVEAHDWTQAVKLYEQETFERVVEPATHAAEAAATDLTHIGLELTLEHVRQYAEMRAEFVPA